MIPLFALALAATPVTLDDVEARARENTQALIAQLDARRALENVTAARSSLLPQVGLSVSTGGTVAGRQEVQSTIPTAGGFESQVVEVPGYTRGSFSLDATLNQVIVDLGKWQSLAQAGAQADAAKGQAREQADTSEFEGIRRFYALYSAQQSLVLLQQNVKRSEYQLDQAKGLYQAGRGQKGDVLSAEVNLGNDRISVIRQQGQIAQAQADLATWLALPGDSDLVAVEPDEVKAKPAPPPALDSALATAKQERPLLQALAAQVSASGHAVSAAKDQYLPRLTGQAVYSRSAPGVDPVFTRWNRQNVLQGSLNLSWDVFSGFLTRSQVGTAEANKTEAQINLEQSEHDVAGAVRAAIENLSALEQAATIAADNRAIAAENLSVAQQRYQAGADTTLDVRDAQLKLASAELTLLQTRTDVEVARASLARAMGTLPSGAKP